MAQKSYSYKGYTIYHLYAGPGKGSYYIVRGSDKKHKTLKAAKAEINRHTSKK